MREANISKWLTTSHIILVISTLGFFIYFNSLFNGFFADDYHQIVDNPITHSLANVPRYFTGSTFYTGIGELSGNYYKPLLTTVYSLLYAVFGKNPAGFHFIQMILHVVNAILIFFLFKFFFKKELSFLFSLIFLTHPINNETVVYIANLQDGLFLFFGLLAIIINKQSFPTKKTYFFRLKSLFVGLLLLLSLLSKETGILFLLVLPLCTLLFEKKHWIRGIIVSFAVLIIYCYLRFLVANIYFNKLITAPIMMLSLQERVMQMPRIIFFYLKTFFFPKDLIIFQTAIIKAVNLNNFYSPLFIDLLFLILLLVSGILVYKRARNLFNSYLFFFVWFLVGLLFHMQLFPLDGTVADRWFYFPIIGLLGIFAVLTNFILVTFHKSTLKMLGVITAIVILVYFSLRVMVRNADWKDQITLISHDIQYNRESYQLEEGYGLELMKMGKLNDAYTHLLRSTQLFPGVNNLTSLGVYYGNTKQFDKAKETLQRAMQYDDLVLTYENYALLLFLTNDNKATEEFSKKALKKFPNSYKLWTYLSISSYALSHYDEALQAATEAYSLNPDTKRKYILYSIKNRQPIDFSKL